MDVLHENLIAVALLAVYDSCFSVESSEVQSLLNGWFGFELNLLSILELLQVSCDAYFSFGVVSF